MRYMMLIYGVDATIAPGQAEQEAEMAAYNAFSREATERGVMLSGEGLYPTSSATTVRLRDGKVLTTDGPFAETKEQLGGFYLLNCKDIDEAIEFAAKIPGARTGSVNVGPLMVYHLIHLPGYLLPHGAKLLTACAVRTCLSANRSSSRCCLSWNSTAMHHLMIIHFQMSV